jgi:hypothetical protein
VTTVNTGDTPTGAQLTDAYPTIVRKTADEANATTTIGDDDELIVPVEANTAYDVEYWLLANVPAATDIKIQHAVPGGTTGWWTPKARTIAGAADTVYQGALAWASQGQVEGSASDIVIEMFGVLVTAGTAGQLKLQWAANAAGTATVKTHSRVRLTKHT